MLQVIINDQKNFSVENENGQVHINNTPVRSDIQLLPNGLISILLNGKSYTAVLEEQDFKKKTMRLRIDGQAYDIQISEPIDQLLSSMGMDMKSMQHAEPVKAPMPGMILKVLVSPGQSIKKGDGLLVLEAMKMENVLKASADATVKAIHVGANTAVEKGAILIELE